MITGHNSCTTQLPPQGTTKRGFLLLIKKKDNKELKCLIKSGNIWAPPMEQKTLQSVTGIIVLASLSKGLIVFFLNAVSSKIRMNQVGPSFGLRFVNKGNEPAWHWTERYLLNRFGNHLGVEMKQIFKSMSLIKDEIISYLFYDCPYSTSPSGVWNGFGLRTILVIKVCGK